MPPKKLTKAEKERLKKEEAERKAAEEEARRLQEEEERKQREEEERKAQEERERLQAIEDARFAEETAALDVWLVHQRGCYEEWKSAEWKEKQWTRYLSCEKLPNPLSECELNTYLQCWELDNDDTKDVDVTFTNIGEALRLCEEIQCILNDEYVPSVSDKHRELLDQVVVKMQRILWDKVDKITCCILEEGNKYLDSEANIKLEHKISKMVFCLWGNLSKNPRLKSFGFNEQEIAVEIPKPLQLADVAVRVMWPPYDPLTRQVERVSVNDADKRGSDEVDTAERLSTVADTVESVQLENNESSAAEGDAIESASIAASEKDKESTVQVISEGEETGVEDNNETSRTTPLDDRQLDSAAAGHVYGLEEDEIDTRAFVPATGGLVMIELLKLPPQPKSINGWTIRQVTDEGVVSQPYPVDPTVTLGSATWSTFNISMKLPEGVMITDDTKIARWDHSKKIWRTGGLTDTKIDTEARTISCMAQHFTPIAIMLDRYTNMPYQMWEMTPKAVNHTLFTICGAITEVSLEIKGHQCCLVSAVREEDKSQWLSHVVNKWTTFHELQEALLSAGVNLFPEHDADTYVSITKKDKAIEAKVYEQMSLVSCVVGFSWSKWSSEVGEQQFVVKACECVTQQTPWELYIAGNRSCKLKMNSSEEEFSADVAENHELHPDIFSTLDKVLSTAAKEHLKEASAEHIECVKQWLLSTKPLTFS